MGSALIPCLLILIVNGLPIGVDAFDYRSCGIDRMDDVCRGSWGFWGLDSGCTERINRPSVDIVRAETSEDDDRVKFELRLAGEVSTSANVLYMFRGKTGTGLLGISRQVTICVVGGTAYLMTDLTRQLLPVKEPRSTAIEGNLLTVRIPKTDIGACETWDFQAFAVEANQRISPSTISVETFHDDVSLTTCPVAEPVHVLLAGAIVALALAISSRRVVR